MASTGGFGESDAVKMDTLFDIEAYMVTFERIMATYSVARARRAFELALQLLGKAQQAYRAMPTEVAAITGDEGITI